MAGEFSKIIVVAQADAAGEAIDDAVTVGDQAAEGAELAVEEAIGEHPEGETHAEVGHEAPAVFPPFNPETFASQLLWLALTFGFLYVLLSRVAIPRIGGILESRRTRIEGDLKEAERLRLETERALASYEEALAQARANAHAIAEETRQGIRADLEGKRAKVEADLGQKMSEAEVRIQATKSAALANVGDIAADTAAAVVRRLSGTVSEADARAAVAAVAKG